MAEDIVTQLRNLAPTLQRGEGRSTVYGSAIEIENLKEELALWKKTARHVRYHHCKPAGCRYCATFAKEYPNDPVVE